MVLLCSLLLCGCGGQPLSKREIVRAVFFAQQGEHYSVCLLLADQNAPEGESAFKTASAAAPTPAQALENAAATLPGTVYYGLLDAAALPVGADWEQAQEIGLLLYDRVQPAPELSVFLLDSADHDWQQDAQGLYERMQAIEDRYKVHCGLQRLFTQHAGCAVPALPQGGGSKGNGRPPPLYRPDGPAGCVPGRADHPPGNHLRRRHRRLHRPRRGDSLRQYGPAPPARC